MESAEASGKTVEDAFRAALARLGATRDEVEMTVLDEGRRPNIFGRGGRDAVVRVERLAPEDRPASAAAPPPGERREPEPAPASARQRAPRGRARAQGSTHLESATPRLTEDDFLRPRPRTRGDGDDDAPAPQSAPPSRGRRAPEPRTRAPEPRPRREPGPAPARSRREAGPLVEPDINAEEVDLAATVVDDILRILDIPAEITIREPVSPGDGRGSVRAVIDIAGDNLGLLIGRRGDTLLALQYLVNLIVTRRLPDAAGVTLDVEHYRLRREEQVTQLARRMADRVRQTGNPITLEPMVPAERRLVHLLLADDPELETNSIGDGENRKVVISMRR